MSSKNKFSSALRHLNSNLDEKVRKLEEQPTNNTGTLYTLVPPNPDASPNVFTPEYQTETTAPLDLSVGSDPTSAAEASDTSGLFDAEGLPMTATPPGDTSYILGPMATMYYAWASKTQIGYIRESDRRMVNLGSITGNFGSWDGNEGYFTSYGQLTLEQAQWYRTIGKKDGANNATENYRAFYPGPPSSVADAYGRYLCTITGEPKETTTDHPQSNSGSAQGPGDATDNFSAMMDRLKNFMSGQSEKARDTVRQILGAFPALGYSADIAASVIQNEPIVYPENEIPKQDVINFLNDLEPSAIGERIPINNGPVAYADENIYRDENGEIQSNIGPNGEKAYYKPDTTGSHIDPKKVLNVRLSAGSSNRLEAAGNAQVQVYRDTETGKWRIRYEDHAYHNLNSADPGEVPDKVKAAASNAVHNVADAQNGRPQGSTSGDVEGGEGWEAATPNATSPNTGAMSNYPCNDTACIRGDVQKSFDVELNSDFVPQALKDALEKNLTMATSLSKKGKEIPAGGIKGNYVGSDYYNQGISNLNQGLTWGGHGEHDNWGQTWNSAKGKWEYNSYEPSGKILSESKKIRIMKTLKEPVVLPEGKKKSYKVRPGRRGKTNFKGMDKLIGDTKIEKTFKEPQDIWNKDWHGYNQRKSQDKKNIVLELVGQSTDAFDYMLTDSKKMNAKQMEEFWGLHPEMYSQFNNGKKYKTVRKEELKGDRLVFLVDEKGIKTSILQSKLNDQLAEKHDQELLDEYNKLNPPKEETVKK